MGTGGPHHLTPQRHSSETDGEESLSEGDAERSYMRLGDGEAECTLRHGDTLSGAAAEQRGEVDEGILGDLAGDRISAKGGEGCANGSTRRGLHHPELSLIHISEPTRQAEISYA